MAALSASVCGCGKHMDWSITISVWGRVRADLRLLSLAALQQLQLDRPKFTAGPCRRTVLDTWDCERESMWADLEAAVICHFLGLVISRESNAQLWLSSISVQPAATATVNFRRIRLHLATVQNATAAETV